MTDAARDTVSPLFVRGVYQQLALSALVAAVFAWLMVMSPTVGGWVFNINVGGALRLSVLGMVIAAAPFVLWLAANVAMTRPRPIAGAVFYWSLSVSFGLAANVILHLLTDESATSVFLVSAAGFGALGMHTRMTGLPPRPWRAFVLFTAIALAVATILDVILTQTLFYFVVDSVGGLMIGALAARASGAFVAIHRAYDFTYSSGAVTDFAALSVFLPRPAPALSHIEERT